MNIHRTLITLAALVFAAHIVAAPPPAAPQTGIAAALAFETGDFMKSTAHKGGAGIGSSMSPSGAFAANVAWESSKSGKWFIEEQRFAANAIGAGLALGDDNLIERGLKMIEWGFAHMEPDGSFKCDDSYHSASFFIEAAAYSLLLLENSAAREKWKPRIEAMKPSLQKAARWMAKPAVSAPVWNGVQKMFAHRRFLCAAALGESGVLLHDNDLIMKSKALIRDGIHIQLPNGVNPEKGGYDSQYQSLGLIFAVRYFSIVADAAQQTEMRRCVDRAFAWLVTRIGPNGTVSAQGNTRTGGQETGRGGAVKGVDFKFVSRALASWAAITRDAKLQDIAQKVSAADPKP